MPDELDAFAHSVRRLVADTAPDQDGWRPGSHQDDRSERLSAGLVELGWDELTSDPDTLPFLATAALELGRVAATTYDIMRLLGGSPLVGGLAMYARPGERVAMAGGADPAGYLGATVVSSNPATFADSLGVHHVTEVRDTHPMPGAQTRMAAWEAATIGYLAGLTGHVVDLAVEHSRHRKIFGRTLAHLDAVQQRLADAATQATMLALSTREGAHGLPALAHASASTWQVMSHAHLIFGALGFTLEFPLQRYSRRAKALGSFLDGWIDCASPHQSGGLW